MSTSYILTSKIPLKYKCVLWLVINRTYAIMATAKTETFFSLARSLVVFAYSIYNSRWIWTSIVNIINILLSVHGLLICRAIDGQSNRTDTDQLTLL